MKILPNESFGFMRVTVERPLRLRWEVSDDTLAAIQSAKGITKLGDADRTKLIDALRSLRGWSSTDHKAPSKTFDPVLKPFGLSAPQVKAVWTALAVTDPEAAAVTDKKGNPEPDPDLRGGENVPLPAVPVVFEADVAGRLESIVYRTAIDDYMAAEVHPYVPDAWVDHTKTRIAYEVPLTRHFYKYVPPRPLVEIDAELKALETEIQLLLRKVTE